MLNAIGFLFSLVTIVVFHYIVRIIINKINKKLDQNNIERHQKTVALLLKLKKYYSEYDKLILVLIISSGYDLNLIIFLQRYSTVFDIN